MRPAEPATSDVPVVTATYCLPLTANVTGYPLTGAPRLTSQSTLPVLSSNALKRPFASPPNTRPPPVATSDSMPARCSCFHNVLPVSAEIAITTPTLLCASGAITPGISRPYTFDGSRVSTVVLAFMHMFCSGMYIALVPGLYAPAGQFLPPLLPGQINLVSSFLVQIASGFTVTLPVAPSILLTTFWNTVERPHRNSPVLRSSV